MYTIQKQQLALNGSSDQWRRPPRCVSIRESVPLLEKVPGCHVLEVGEEGKGHQVTKLSEGIGSKVGSGSVCVFYHTVELDKAS